MSYISFTNAVPVNAIILCAFNPPYFNTANPLLFCNALVSINSPVSGSVICCCNISVLKLCASSIINKELCDIIFGFLMYFSYVKNSYLLSCIFKPYCCIPLIKLYNNALGLITTTLLFGYNVK